MILINSDAQLATLSLSTADVFIVLHAGTMRINTRLGSLDLRDDSPLETASPEFKQILSIEGDNFADFQYQTFNPEDKETYTGVKSAVHLNAGSLKLHYLEQSLHDIHLFLAKLAELKGLYDAATTAAVQRASEIERMQFDISIKTPIIVFPCDHQQSLDVLTLRLGEFAASNSYTDVSNHTNASLRGIQFASQCLDDNKLSMLKMVDDININASITQTGGIERSKETNQPDTQVCLLCIDQPFSHQSRRFKFKSLTFDCM